MLLVSNQFKTPEFKALFTKWNAILEKDGLKEIEDFSLPEPPLKCWHHLKWNRTSSEKVKEAHTYYEAATLLLKDFAFRNSLHRKVWELHCEGFSVRKISLTLGKRRIGKSTVHEIILIIERQSGLRHG